MSLTRRLFELLYGSGRVETSTPEARFDEQFSSPGLAPEGGAPDPLEPERVDEVARSLGIPPDQIDSMMESGAGRTLLSALVLQQSGSRVQPAAPSSGTAECPDCHRAVARARGACLYCGAELPLDE